MDEWEEISIVQFAEFNTTSSKLIDRNPGADDE